MSPNDLTTRESYKQCSNFLYFALLKFSLDVMITKTSCPSLNQRFLTFVQIFLLCLLVRGPVVAQSSLTVTFTTEGSCANMPISFYPAVTPAADSLQWDFGDGRTANSWNANHTYTSAGSFTVKVTAHLNGSTTTASQNITLTPFDVKLTLAADTTGCFCEFFDTFSCDPLAVSANVEGGNPIYQWYSPFGLMPGRTTPTMFPDSAGYYYLVATQGACSTYAGVNVSIHDSQNRQPNAWRFGHQGAIDFAYGTAWTNFGDVDSPEGSATIADGTGRVLFSTDGQKIYNVDRNDITPAPLPPGLGGDSGSTQ
jgi:large repetitive protein